MARRLSHWGWGYEDEQPSRAELQEAARVAASLLGFEPAGAATPVPLEHAELRASRLQPPQALARICSSATYDRASHTYGKSYRDVVRGFRGDFRGAPDVVAYPGDEGEIEALLEWCASVNAAVVPFGGGTSVVGGVEPPADDGRYDGVVSIDLRRLDRVLEIDRVSRAARIQGGAAGPVLERQLAADGLTLRHFPQSFQFSTLGGWIATRAGGHYATLHTRIDDFVESVRAITPTGRWESLRVPGSGAGPSPDRMLLGSEGTLGLVTEAWMRLQDKPVHRRSAGVPFAAFCDGVEAVRAIAQAGLHPANCRLIDATEAALTAGGDGEHALLLLGFEAADHPVDARMDRALALAEACGGRFESRDGSGSGGAGAWRDAFVKAPYLRNVHTGIGVLTETFETAITWERFAGMHAEVLETAREKVREVSGDGVVTCRFTYAYPDGPAPYYTVLAPARRGEELDQWDAVKGAVSAALLDAGGTITHHHAVGRDHRPWYERQRPEPFAAALRGAKAAVDPRGILNPGVLVDPAG